MANNPYKRDIVNRALMILNAGRTAVASVFFDDIDDTEFADWTTVSDTSSTTASGEADKRMVCMLYERVLKQVLEDMRPDFACEYADLGQPMKTTKEDGGWSYLFELPTGFLSLVKQCAEGAPDTGFDCELLHLTSYSHTVVGTDGNVYYCTTSHTSVDDTAKGQPPDDDGDGNWTLDAAEVFEGATWAEGVAYKTAATGLLLATNHLTDDAGGSAYIQYLAYVRAGRSDQPQYYPENFANAFATRLAAEMALDGKDYERRRRLLEEYEALAKPQAWAVQNRHKSRVRPKTVFEARTSY